MEEAGSLAFQYGRIWSIVVPAGSSLRLVAVVLYRRFIREYWIS